MCVLCCVWCSRHCATRTLPCPLRSRYTWVVTVGGLTSAPSAFTSAYVSPAITGLTPSSGVTLSALPTTGGSVVIIGVRGVLALVLVCARGPCEGFVCEACRCGLCAHGRVVAPRRAVTLAWWRASPSAPSTAPLVPPRACRTLPRGATSQSATLRFSASQSLVWVPC